VSVTVRLARRVPTARGLNLTVAVHVPTVVSVALMQVVETSVKSPALVPVMATFVMVTVPVPPLLIVMTVFGESVPVLNRAKSMRLKLLLSVRTGTVCATAAAPKDATATMATSKRSAMSRRLA
jgi:hypothetical protein